MDYIGILLLILAGILLFLLEFLVVPGVTIAGIAGLLFLGGAVYLAFENYNVTTGLIVLAAVVLIIVVSLIFALRARTWKRISLHSDINSRVSEVEKLGFNVGDKGVALTRLNPIGSVLINDQRVEGHSQGSLIFERTPVEVIQITRTYLIVKTIEKE